MLTRMRIVNIQKHKDLDLTLDRINVITGATDSGKTAVLRALTWALTNDESGSNLINNDGATTCSVRITTENGDVTRSWSKGKNAYSLGDKEFTTFRTGVPEPIARLLNIEDINIQRRRDLPFMVYFKASECANQFSDMMDLAEIDTIIAASNKSVKQHTEKVEKLKQEKECIEDELKSYTDLDDALDELESLKCLKMTIDDKTASVERLKTLRKRYDNALCAFNAVFDPSEAIEVFADIDALKYLLYDVITGKVDYLTELRKDYNNAEYNLASKPDTTEAEKHLKSLFCREEVIRNLHEHVTKISQLKDKYNYKKFEVASTEQVYESLRDEFKREFPKVCPLCGKEDCND